MIVTTVTPALEPMTDDSNSADKNNSARDFDHAAESYTAKSNNDPRHHPQGDKQQRPNNQPRRDDSMA